MIRIRDMVLPMGYTAEMLTDRVASQLHLPKEKVLSVKLVRRSIDARKKPDVHYVCTVDAAIDGSEKAVIRRCKKASLSVSEPYFPPPPVTNPVGRPVVIGFGPAGMFAALILAMAGLRPIVLERGEDAETRSRKVADFFATGKLDTNSNIQFGEGGAGTFSDGKLNTGVNNPRIPWILEQFHAFGAREDILYDAKPHVGTDVLLHVVQNLRKKVIALGGEVRFSAHVTGIQQENGALSGVVLRSGEVVACKQAILAIGHSARDTFSMLHNLGISMEPKPFAMGVRIEHPQRAINMAQFGTDNPGFPPADYKLVAHLDARTVYTFCMCPGGHVVAAASEEGGVVTNGMSNADREGENANAALLVSLNPKDFPYPGVLGGVQWQEEIEKRAFLAGGQNYRAPAQTVGSFLWGEDAAPNIVPSYRPGVTWCNLRQVLPQVITDSIAEALPILDHKLSGFAHPGAVMTAPETRSSSPVRILRDAEKVSSLPGLYPAGEGAGYAGGIMSAAIDGICCAEALIEAIKQNEPTV